MQLTIDEVDYNSGFIYIDPKAMKYELSTGIYLLTDNKNTFKDTENEANGKTVRITLTTPHKITFTSPLEENLGFLQENYVAGTFMCTEPIKMATIDKVLLKCD